MAEPKMVYKAGTCSVCWDPGMIRKLTASERKAVVDHEKAHLALARRSMIEEAYAKALVELKKLEDGSWS